MALLLNSLFRARRNPVFNTLFFVCVRLWFAGVVLPLCGHWSGFFSPCLFDPLLERDFLTSRLYDAIESRLAACCGNLPDRPLLFSGGHLCPFDTSHLLFPVHHSFQCPFRNTFVPSAFEQTDHAVFHEHSSISSLHGDSLWSPLVPSIAPSTQVSMFPPPAFFFLFVAEGNRSVFLLRDVLSPFCTFLF